MCSTTGSRRVEGVLGRPPRRHANTRMQKDRCLKTGGGGRGSQENLCKMFSARAAVARAASGRLDHGRRYLNRKLRAAGEALRFPLVNAMRHEQSIGQKTKLTGRATWGSARGQISPSVSLSMPDIAARREACARAATASLSLGLRDHRGRQKPVELYVSGTPLDAYQRCTDCYKPPVHSELGSLDFLLALSRGGPEPPDKWAGTHAPSQARRRRDPWA